jgi:predicted TPR repeat methyltransferase
MLFKESPEKFWNLIGSLYAKSPIADRAAYEAKIEKIKSYLSAEDVLLDIGCGTGTQCGDLAGNVKQATGIDISGKLLAIAEQRMAERKLDNVSFIKTSVFDECLPADGFNVVMAFYVLHFYGDIDAVFKRIHALLKSGGLFISETATLGDQGKFMGSLLRFAGKLGLLPTMNFLTTEQIEQALEKAGFSVVDKTRFSDKIPEYTLIAKKTN